MEEAQAQLCAGAGGELDDIVKTTLLLTDLANFTKVNEIMASYFQPPYPARATYQVAGLPRGAMVEVEAIMELMPVVNAIGFAR